MVRQLLYAAFMHPYLQALQKSADALPGTPLLETDSFFAMIG